MLNEARNILALLESLRAAGISKPILTGYLPPYDPNHDPAGRGNNIFEIRRAYRHQGLLFRLEGDPVPNWPGLAAPPPAKFASLHFLFADGALNEELTIDSSIYFFVDEIAISLRAYTLGYDLFYPHRILGWHLYNRATRVTHWHDNPDSRAQQEITSKRIQALYQGRWQGKYGLGKVRSALDYEKMVGEPLFLQESARW